MPLQLFKNTHTILGLCVCIFFALQVPLGLLHHRHFRRHGERGLVSYAHIWYGRAVMILGIVNGGLGLQLARPDNGLVVAYAVTAAVMGVFYGCAAVLGAIRRRRAAKHAVSSARRNKGAEGSSVSDRDQGGMSPRH